MGEYQSKVMSSATVPAAKRCETCRGTGELKVEIKTAKGVTLTERRRCPACNGRAYGYATK